MIINLEYLKSYSPETDVFGTAVCCLKFYNIQSVLRTVACIIVSPLDLCTARNIFAHKHF